METYLARSVSTARLEELAFGASAKGILPPGQLLGVDADGPAAGVPSSKSMLHEVLGRFNRFGRQTPLTVHVLSPSNAGKSLPSAPLETIRDIFGPPAVEGIRT